jgi:LmbE family N-acetylglucosaminyl deacetylase
MVDLLLVVPHPDDEVFGCGGLFSRMAQFGKKVGTLTLTRGGAGRTLGLCSQADLPKVREQELRESLDALGVAEGYIWDYPDFVPDGDRDMEHRDGLQAISADDIVPKIQKLIDDLAPKTLLTFAPNGSNGHPDHVSTHKFVLAALECSSHRPEKLFYFASEKAYDAETRAGFLAPELIREQHLFPSHYVHVQDFLEPKLRAMGCHRTQALSVLNFMQRIPRRIHVESFHQARPEMPKGEGARTVMWL